MTLVLSSKSAGPHMYLLLHLQYVFERQVVYLKMFWEFFARTEASATGSML